MKYHLSQIIARHDAGESLKYLFFWGHQPNKDGTIGASCFSQWWEQPFEADAITYRTAEHWMMASKARLFGDEEMLAKILAAKSPAEAKKLGREVRNFDQATWESHHYNIVLEGNRSSSVGQFLRTNSHAIGPWVRFVNARPRRKGAFCVRTSVRLRSSSARNDASSWKRASA